jgi:lysophospholipase L1-like esterase
MSCETVYQSRTGPSRHHPLVVLLALLPGAVSGLVLVIIHRQDKRLVIDSLDLAIGAAFISYFCAVAVAAAFSRYCARFLLVVYATVFGLLLAEVFLRVLYPPPPDLIPWPPMHRVTTVGDSMPGVAGKVEFSVNSLGVRGPEVRLDDCDPRILCVGGSTTECLYVTDELTWPWLVHEQLGRRLGKNVFVGNAGKSGLLSPHHLYLLERYRYVERFDTVLLLCGINDLGALVLGSRSFDQRQRDAGEESMLPTVKDGRPFYRRFALVRHLSRLPILPPRTNARIQDPRGDWIPIERESRRRALQTKTIHEISPKLSLGCAVYAATLKKIIYLCRSRQQTIYLMTQPSIYRRNLPEDLQGLLWNNQHASAFSVEALEAMIAAFNRTMLDVCRQEGVDCLDLAVLIPKDTSAFYDDCHFNIAGNAKVAAAVTDFLAARFLNRKPRISPNSSTAAISAARTSGDREHTGGDRR